MCRTILHKPTIALARREAVDRGGLEGLAGLQFRSRELGMIRRVGKMLCFQAEGVTLLVDLASGSGDRAVEEVAGIELHAGLVGEDFEDASGGGLVGFGG